MYYANVVVVEVEAGRMCTQIGGCADVSLFLLLIHSIA